MKKTSYIKIEEPIIKNFSIVYIPFVQFNSDDDPDWDMSLVNESFNSYEDACNFATFLLKNPDAYITYKENFSTPFKAEDKEKLKDIFEIGIFEEVIKLGQNEVVEDIIESKYVSRIFKDEQEELEETPATA